MRDYDFASIICCKLKKQQQQQQHSNSTMEKSGNTLAG